MDKELFRRAVTESGLPKAAIAFLYNVTRPTIYSWLADGEPKNASLLAHANRVTAALNAAIQRHILPFSAGITPRQRAQHIQNMHRALTNAR